MNIDSIARHKRDIAKLQKELDLAYALLESANSIVIRWDKDGIIYYINDFGLKFFGYSSEELIDQHLSKILPKVEKSTSKDLFNLPKDITINPDQYASVQNENITKDGRTVWVTWINKVIFDEQGNFCEILAIGNDITALKEAEQQRFEYHEKLGAALENMGDAVFISDNQGNFLHFNKAFATFHRFKDKSECWSRLADYPDILDVSEVDGERLPLDQWVVPRALRGETATNAEYTLQRKDTGETWIGSYAFGPFFDEQGNIAGSVVAARDMTELKKSEEENKNLTDRLLLATASARLGVWDWGVRENTMLWDDRMFEMYGVTREETPSNIDAWLNGLHPEDKEAAIAACQAALDGEKDFDTEFRVFHPDGTIKHLKANGLVINGADGKPDRMLGINMDITEEKQTEVELLEAKTELDSKNKYLEEANIALNVLIKEHEKNKDDLKKNVLFAVEKLIFPTLNKLKDKVSNHNQRKYLDVIESNLNQIASPFVPAVASYILKLTPAQIQIANLIKQGMTTKEIATLLNLSPATIAAQRQNIRKRLAVPSKTALRTILLANR